MSANAVVATLARAWTVLAKPPSGDRSYMSYTEVIVSTFHSGSAMSKRNGRRSRNAYFANFLLLAAHAVLWLVFAASPTNATERDELGVRSAFRAATSGPAHSTVKITCDGHSAAFGTVVSSDGYIVTKASEMEGKIFCQLYGISRRLEAKIVGVDEEYDVALLKIWAENLPVIKWSRAAPPPVGSWLATTAMSDVPVSIGVVSVKPREIKRRVAALGIIIEDADGGARVHQVVPGSGAGKAGIRRDDIITHLESNRVESRDALIRTVTQFCPGDKVRVEMIRGGKPMTTDAILSDLAELAGGDENTELEKLGGPLSKRRAGFPVVIQHDTVLQPSECGGPLVNLDGEAVGINIARASRVASYAIPADVVRSLVDELKSHQTVSTTPVD